MEKVIFECETITPMFLAGADGVTPELRAPGIKGALRFWWRALHGHLPLNDMKQKEAKIFGGTDQAGKSLISINVLDLPNSSDFKIDYPTPHNKKFSKNAIKEGFVFQVKLGLQKSLVISNDDAINLFTFFTLIGGVGNRSRRGFGCFKINRINNLPFNFLETKENILGLIQKICPEYRIDQINHNSKYPYLINFELGNRVNSLIDIGQATHDVMFRLDTSENKVEYKATLGAGNPRFSSPIYISYLPSGNSIFSFLNIQSPNMANVNKYLTDSLFKKLT